MKYIKNISSGEWRGSGFGGNRFRVGYWKVADIRGRWINFTLHKRSDWFGTQWLYLSIRILRCQLDWKVWDFGYHPEEETGI